MAQEVIAIAAVDTGYGIGRDGTIPWHCPEDLLFFKKQTVYQPVIMGRKTFESLKMPNGLPGRPNIVITSKKIDSDQVFSAPNPEKAMELAQILAEQVGLSVFVIGGASIYEHYMEQRMIDKLLLTHIPDAFDCDTFFPIPHDDEWEKDPTFEPQELKFEQTSPAIVHRYQRKK